MKHTERYNSIIYKTLYGAFDREMSNKMLFNAVIKSGVFKKVSIENPRRRSTISVEASPDMLNILMNASIQYTPATQTFVIDDNHTATHMDRLLLEETIGWETNGMGVSVYKSQNTAPHHSITMKLANSQKSIVVAEVYYPNIINILLDINLSGSDIVQTKFNFKILSFVIKQGINILRLNKYHFFEQIYTQGKAKIMDMLSSTRKHEIESVSQKIDSKEKELSRLINDVKQTKEDIRELKENLERMVSLQSKNENKIFSEVDRIKNIAGVESVDMYSRIVNSEIVVSTKPIIIKCQKLNYLAGKFDIIINLADKTVRFINTSDIKRQSYWGSHCHHPHCSENGKPCLGNISTQVTELLSDFELSFLVILCISYLESVNINDAAGKNIINWPVCDNNGNIIDTKRQSLKSCSVCGTFMPEVDNEDWHECDVCGGWTCPNHIYKITVDNQDKMVCESCHSLFERCDVCGEFHLKTELSACGVCGKRICPNCNDSKFNACKSHVRHCHEHNVDYLENDGCYICNSDEQSMPCSWCGEIKLKSELGPNRLCDKCGGKVEKCPVCNKLAERESLVFDFRYRTFAHKNCTATREIWQNTNEERIDENV